MTDPYRFLILDAKGNSTEGDAARIRDYFPPDQAEGLVKDVLWGIHVGYRYRRGNTFIYQYGQRVTFDAGTEPTPAA